MRTAERDLKNIRKVLKSNISEFAKSIAISEEELIKIEEGNRKLTGSELYIICSLLLNVIDSIVSPKNDAKMNNIEENKERIEAKKTFILKMLSDYIITYNPVNKEKEDININDFNDKKIFIKSKKV